MPTSMSKTSTSNKRRLVLVVDDDAGVCDVIRSALEHYGYDAQCARGGPVALDLASKHAFDVAIVDRLLPGNLSGDAVAEELRHRGIPVIMTSGSMDAHHGLAKLPYPFLMKPFRSPALMVMIEDVLTVSC